MSFRQPRGLQHNATPRMVGVHDWSVMNGVGKIAQFPCGRRTKWLVVAFWVVVLVVAGPLAGKLTGVQKNDAVEWLPQSAESTKVFKLSAQFGTDDEAPAVVVYERPAGITPGDLAAATADRYFEATSPESRSTYPSTIRYLVTRRPKKSQSSQINGSASSGDDIGPDLLPR